MLLFSSQISRDPKIPNELDYSQTLKLPSDFLSTGMEEYPGPPQYDEDSKEGIREGIEEPLITVADVTEDLAGFFVQCDVCKVWQHGGCVGIQSEEQSPEEYFCEECRKDLHKIFTAPNG